MNESQKETIKWIAIVGVGGLILYNVGKKLGIFSEKLPNAPNADNNSPKASDYTHTPGFDAEALVQQIVDDWTTFGGDPFDIIFQQIKQNIATQGDWQVFSQTFTTDKNTSFGDYVTSGWYHAFWATLSKTELAQIVDYINRLPL